MNNIEKPVIFEDILELQKIADEKINEPRKNFKTREQKFSDIRAAIMDEFMEFRKELPYNLNFKTWKQKKWSAKKQLEEFVDMLFFIAIEINGSSVYDISEKWNKTWEHIDITAEIDDMDLHFFMSSICSNDISSLLKKYIIFAKRLGYSEKDILEQYWEKWQKNTGSRINEDWTL